MLASRKTFGLATFLALAASCTTDPMNGTDGISPVAGLAQIRNADVHVINPNAGYHARNNPGSSGKRAAVVIERYNTDTVETDAGEDQQSSF